MMSKILLLALCSLVVDASAINLEDPNLTEAKDQRVLTATVVVPGNAAREILNVSSSTSFARSSLVFDGGASVGGAEDRVAK